jgi:hypothetical protein
MENRVIDFYQRIGLYDEELFKKIKERTTIIDGNNSVAIDFYGVYLKDDEFSIVLPKITSVFEEVIWVHEYAHIILHLYLDDDSELFPNLMESYFINMYVDDKTDIIKRTEEEIERSQSVEHTLAKKIKLFYIT